MTEKIDVAAELTEIRKIADSARRIEMLILLNIRLNSSGGNLLPPEANHPADDRIVIAADRIRVDARPGPDRLYFAGFLNRQDGVSELWIIAEAAKTGKAEFFDSLDEAAQFIRDRGIGGEVGYHPPRPFVLLDTD